MTTHRFGRYVRACHVEDVPVGEGRTALVGGMRVAIFHTAGGWHCMDADCPHLRGPLADGLLADASVTCPLHQRRFDLSTGEPIGHDCPAAVTYPVELRGDEVYVAVRTRATRPAAAVA